MHSLPNMAKPSGKSTRHEMEYYDGQRRTEVLPTNMPLLIIGAAVAYTQ